MSTLKDKSNSILTEKQNKIIPENIKSGETILGITGTYTGEITNTVDENTGVVNALVSLSYPSVEVENIPGIFGKFLYVEPVIADDSRCVLCFALYIKDNTELLKLIGDKSYIDKIIQIYVEGEDTPFSPVVRFYPTTYSAHADMGITAAHTNYTNLKITRIAMK